MITVKPATDKGDQYCGSCSANHIECNDRTWYRVSHGRNPHIQSVFTICELCLRTLIRQANQLIDGV